MHKFFEAYLERQQALHTELEEALDGLSPEALDWTLPEMNSIAVLVTHLAGAERYWIGDVAVGEPSGRVRSAEFEARGLDAAALSARLAANREYTRAALGKLALEDLAAERLSPRDGRSFSVAWALLHALEHTGIHLGHIQIARQLWDRRA